MMDEEKQKAKPPKAAVEAQPLPAQVAAPEPVKLTPEQWAKKLGHFRKAPANQPQLVDSYHWKHAAAASLHGWSEHAHHYALSPLMLAQSDYEAALEAAAEYPNKPAHKAALGKTKESR